MTNYRSVSLRRDFLEEIDQFVEENSRYQSRADFCREAIREKMERLEVRQ